MLHKVYRRVWSHNSNLLLSHSAPLIRLGAEYSFVQRRHFWCMHQAWELLPIFVFVCVLQVWLITATSWSRAKKEPLDTRFENDASILTMVTLLKTRVPVSLSQHNQMLGCQKGVLSQPHLLILLPTFYHAATSGTALPENWLGKKKKLFLARSIPLSDSQHGCTNVCAGTIERMLWEWERAVADTRR